jgi:hypothetical protein
MASLMIRKYPMFIVIGMMVSHGRTFRCPSCLARCPPFAPSLQNSWRRPCITFSLYNSIKHPKLSFCRCAVNETNTQCACTDNIATQKGYKNNTGLQKTQAGNNTSIQETRLSRQFKCRVSRLLGDRSFCHGGNSGEAIEWRLNSLLSEESLM